MVELEYQKQDMFKVDGGDWLVVVESDEENGTYEVAEKVGEEVEYFSSDDLEELVEEGVLQEVGKMDDASFTGVYTNNKLVDIRRITRMASISVDS